VDLSAASEGSARYALDMARQLDAEVVFLYVVPQTSMAGRLLLPWGASPQEADDLSAPERERALERLRAYIEPMPLEGLRYVVKVRRGVPHTRILQAVDSMKPDLVVQGTHGSTGMEDRVIGGTAERIIRRTRCPVISVKPREFGRFLPRIGVGIGLLEGLFEGWKRGMPREPYRFPPERILYATDFSEASHLAMPHAVSLAHLCGAPLIVLHVVQEGEDPVDGEEDGSGAPGDGLTAAERMEILLREVTAYHGGLRIDPRIVETESTSKILSVAIEEEVDLLVMGTRGLTGWELMLTGSTADNAIHNAPCPVLTVRPNWKLEQLGKKFRRVFRSLTPVDLQRMSSGFLTTIEDDPLASPERMKGSELFLNYYSKEGISTALEQYGILDRLRQDGLQGFRVTLDLEDPYRQRLRLYHGGREEPDHLLVDLVAREGTCQFPERSGVEGSGAGGQGCSVLLLEWLCMQNPSADFSPVRPPLPGQEHPGLGVGYEVYLMLVHMGIRVRKEGLMNRPQFYHNARFYHERFKFIDPVREGRLIAMIRDTGDHNLADVSWAVYHGCLVDESTGQPAPWEGGILVYPLARKVRQYFDSRAYHDAVWETVANSRFRIDWDLFVQRMRTDGRTRGEAGPAGGPA